METWVVDCHSEFSPTFKVASPPPTLFQPLSPGLPCLPSYSGSSVLALPGGVAKMDTGPHPEVFG